MIFHAVVGAAFGLFASSPGLILAALAGLGLL